MLIPSLDSGLLELLLFFCLLILQLLHSLCQQRNCLKQFANQCHHCIFPLPGYGSNFFFSRNTQSWHTPIFNGFLVFGNVKVQQSLRLSSYIKSLNREARKGCQENRYFLRVLSGLRGKISLSFPR